MSFFYCATALARALDIYKVIGIVYNDLTNPMKKFNSAMKLSLYSNRFWGLKR